MNQSVVQGILDIAYTHIHHLQKSKAKLQHAMPLTPDAVEAFDDDDIAIWDAFTIRFCKLQDLMGAKLFDAVLSLAGFNLASVSIIDQVNALEKLELMQDASIWKQIRKIRNNLTDEYPDTPVFTAATLNEAFVLSDILCQIVDNINTFSKKQGW